MTAAVVLVAGVATALLAGPARSTAPAGPRISQAALRARVVPAPRPRSQIRALPAASRVGAAPAAAASYYMKTARLSILARRGCHVARAVNKGRHPREALVVLAFGRPRQSGGRFGASLFSRRFTSTTVIRQAGEAFAAGFWRCVRKSLSPSLRLALGTSNFGDQVSFAHGRAWARMVNEANRSLRAKGYRAIEVLGANDIELAWNGPAVTRAWVHGYDSVNLWPYYNFGDAASCPPYGDCHGAWTLEDVWWVSWGARPAIPLPQIYTGSGSSARQWYQVVLYGHRRHGTKMAIAGVMSQHRACHQSADPCRGMSNTPNQAWSQLSRMLNSDHRTAQRVRWATDIAWRR